ATSLAPRAMSLLPLYVLSLLKSPSLRTSGGEKLDVRSMCMSEILRGGVDAVKSIMYARCWCVWKSGELSSRPAMAPMPVGGETPAGVESGGFIDVGGSIGTREAAGVSDEGFLGDAECAEQGELKDKWMAEYHDPQNPDTTLPVTVAEYLESGIGALPVDPSPSRLSLASMSDDGVYLVEDRYAIYLVIGSKVPPAVEHEITAAQMDSGLPKATSTTSSLPTATSSSTISTHTQLGRYINSLVSLICFERREMLRAFIIKRTSSVYVLVKAVMIEDNVHGVTLNEFISGLQGEVRKLVGISFVDESISINT
ncbi:hypothetical protein ADUPG1_011219, partial [Aduncisulcus paluster]